MKLIYLSIILFVLLFSPRSTFVTGYHIQNQVGNSSLDIMLNSSISSIEIMQNSSLFLTLTLKNVSSSETVGVDTSPTFWLIDSDGEFTSIATQIFLRFESTEPGRWNVSRDNFLDIRPRATIFEVRIDVNGTEIAKSVPFNIKPFDNNLPTISVDNLSNNEIVSPRHILEFEIIENIRLLRVEVLKNNEVYFALDMAGPEFPPVNNTQYFANSTYFKSHGLQLGPSSQPSINLTIRAMDYSHIWTNQTIEITVDGQGPKIEFLGLDLITTQYLSVPHLEIRENDPLILRWSAEDEFSIPDHYGIEIDGEYWDTVHEKQVDLTNTLKPRYFAYSILVTPFDSLNNRGSSIEVTVLVLTENGEILRDDLGQSPVPSKNSNNWTLVVGFVIIAYLAIRILFTTKSGKAFLKKYFKPIRLSDNRKK